MSISVSNLILSVNKQQRLSLGVPFSTVFLGGIAADLKSGEETAGNFTAGVATVVFATAYPDTTYTVTLGIDGVTHSFSPRVENKATTGFDINLGTTSLGGLSAVMWQTAPKGE